MEIVHFTHLSEITQLIIGQVGSSCAAPSWWQSVIITGLITASGLVLASTGVGFAGIVSVLIGLITTGATIDSIAVALGAHLNVVGNSMAILGELVIAIQKVLGC